MATGQGRFAQMTAEEHELKRIKLNSAEVFKDYLSEKGDCGF
jgi:hypothetical protein